LEVQDLLKQYATHPQVVALNTLLKDKTSCNIFLKGLSGSGAAMTIASLFSKRRGNYVCILNDLEEAGYFYHDLIQLIGGDGIYFFPSAYRRAIKYGHVNPANEILSPWRRVSIVASTTASKACLAATLLIPACRATSSISCALFICN
jgi:transcription-repair coupling factor (superfamily II helicase)